MGHGDVYGRELNSLERHDRLAVTVTAAAVLIE